jgi:hypothetical protein
MPVQKRQESATPSLSQEPVGHSVHCDVVALVQVIDDWHLSTSLQARQASATPDSSSQKPDLQVVHCELAALVQVSGELQFVTAAQSRHAS